MALTWCLPGQANALSLAVLKRVQLSGAIVPAVWHLEMANILGLKLRSGNLSQRELHDAVALLRLLNISTEERTQQITLPDLLALMAKIRLTAYDATYIDLALRTGTPLATFDKEMIEAAKQNAVSLVSS
jgi:predicted nucleic acid-binding protein